MKLHVKCGINRGEGSVSKATGKKAGEGLGERERR